MYLCVKDIDFISFYDFDIWFWNCYHCVLIIVLTTTEVSSVAISWEKKPPKNYIAVNKYWNDTFIE